MKLLNASLLEHEEARSMRSMLMINLEFTCMDISMEKFGELQFIQENKSLCLVVVIRLCESGI